MCTYFCYNSYCKIIISNDFGIDDPDVHNENTPTASLIENGVEFQLLTMSMTNFIQKI